jgi:hypothetical protein
MLPVILDFKHADKWADTHNYPHMCYFNAQYANIKIKKEKLACNISGDVLQCDWIFNSQFMRLTFYLGTVYQNSGVSS